MFRKWATAILKDYMLKGYAVNQRREESNTPDSRYNNNIENRRKGMI